MAVMDTKDFGPSGNWICLSALDKFPDHYSLQVERLFKNGFDAVFCQTCFSAGADTMAIPCLAERPTNGMALASAYNALPQRFG